MRAAAPEVRHAITRHRSREAAFVSSGPSCAAAAGRSVSGTSGPAAAGADVLLEVAGLALPVLGGPEVRERRRERRVPQRRAIHAA